MSCDPSPPAGCPEGGCEPDVGRLKDAGPTDGGLADALADGCHPERATCLDAQILERCDAEGRLRQERCLGATRCVVDRCSAALCTPQALVCRRGLRFRCGADGFSLERDPCPAGLTCAEGACVDPSPLGLLVVDTSASMAEAVDAGGWVLACDAPEAWRSRLGQVKLALTALLSHPLAEGLSLGLVRFPQGLQARYDCPQGHTIGAQLPLEGGAARALAPAELAALLPLVLAEPLPLDGADNRSAVAAWLDHRERFGPLGTPCGPDCPGLCLGQRCYAHLDPELRPDGNTPIGKTLFVAAEYLAQATLRDGLPCAEDADCGAAYAGCVAGRCRDPLGACRGRVVILLTDGGETEDPEPGASFFEPRTQARRMRYGLGCLDDADCLPGARCQVGQCLWGRCGGGERRCAVDAECPPGQGCALERLPLPPGAGGRPWTLRHPDGSAAPVVLHVIDASPGGQAAALAAWGGGQHIPVADFDAASLLDQLLPLLTDAKDRALSCLVDAR